MNINKIVIAGAGTMGYSMAQIFAQFHYQVMIYDFSDKAIENAKKRISENIDILIDEMSKQKSVKSEDYFIEQPIKTEDGAYVQFSYMRRLPGRNKLLEQERRYLRLNIRKVSETEVVVDVRQQSAIDSKNAVGFIEKISKADEGIKIKHINLGNLIIGFINMYIKRNIMIL